MKSVMRKMMFGLVALVGVLGCLGCGVLGAESVSAASCKDAGHVEADGRVSDGWVDTSLFGCMETGKNGDGIFTILDIVLTVMTVGVGIAATVGLVIAAIMYLTARDNEGQAAKAKTRILEIVIGLAIWVLMYAALKFLLPGFNY